MKKLINKNIILYIKHGYVLYGLSGLKININEFDDWYWNSNSIKSKYKSLYEKINPKPINKNPEFAQFYKEELDKYNKEFDENYLKFFNDNFIKYNDGYYYKRTSDLGKQILLERSLLPTQYQNYFRDSLGLLYKRNTSSYATNKKFIKISEDIKYGDRVILKAVEPSAAQKVSSNSSSKFKNFGKYHNDQNIGYGDYNGQKIAVRYNKDSKTWTYNYVDDNENTWLNADDALSKYLNEIYKNLLTPAKKSEEAKKEEPSKPGLDADPDAAKPDVTAPGAAAPGAAADDAGSLINHFDPLVTDPRTILRSTRLEKPATTVTKPKATLRVLPKAVARPENMPLMDRSDVRYTISDITGASPYGSSDIELVNSLANTPDNNMFKQALMNRLGMSKWSNDVALNKLNSLGIRGHIGGSDRKRLRNLINKGTTINGKIRK